MFDDKQKKKIEQNCRKKTLNLCTEQKLWGQKKKNHTRQINFEISNFYNNIAFWATKWIHIINCCNSITKKEKLLFEMKNFAERARARESERKFLNDRGEKKKHWEKWKNNFDIELVLRFIYNFH